MKNFVKLLCTFFLLNLISAQGLYNLAIDCLLYKNDSTSNYLEIAYSFNKKNNKIIESEIEKAYLNLIIKNAMKETYINKTWTIEKQDSINNMILGNLNIELPFGEYDVKLILRNAKEITMIDSSSVIIKNNKFNKIAISDICTASNIIQSTNENSQFFKTKYEVYPNPMRIFTKENPIYYYYYEIYNESSENINLKIVKILLNQENKEIYSKEKIIDLTKKSTYDLGTVDLRNYNSGKYKFVINILKDDIIIDSKNTEIYLINKNKNETKKTLSGDFLTSAFATFSEEECDDMNKKIYYLAKENDKKMYKSLNTLEAKQKFLFDFWEKIEAGNEYNLTYNLYIDRLNYVNEHFSGMMKKGFQTDRGRIYLLYGNPTNISRFPASQEYKPYEIWEYEGLEGGVAFVFADINGINIYELIHSTKRGELYDENWERRIRGY